jgi:hypothetical protein
MKTCIALAAKRRDKPSRVCADGRKGGLPTVHPVYVLPMAGACRGTITRVMMCVTHHHRLNNTPHGILVTLKGEVVRVKVPPHGH